MNDELMVLVEYRDSDDFATGWDIWQYGRPIADFHADNGDVYVDAYEYACYCASRIAFERLPEPVVEDWNNPVWQAYEAPFDTDAGTAYVLDVFGTED